MTYIHADIASKANLSAIYAAHARETRRILLERETAALEARIALRFGFARRVYELGFAVTAGIATSMLAVGLCLAQIGGAL